MTARQASSAPGIHSSLVAGRSPGRQKTQAKEHGRTLFKLYGKCLNQTLVGDAAAPLMAKELGLLIRDLVRGSRSALNKRELIVPSVGGRVKVCYTSQ